MSLHPAARRLAILLTLALGLLGPTAPGGAQIPSDFTNLEVLPKDIPREQLLSVMKGFSTALGVRCNFCHVGENPNDLAGYDFASDEKEHKRVARIMLQMTHEINERLLPQTGRAELVRVQCVTCHRGVAEPRTLRDELLMVLEKEGAEAAIARYDDLRAEQYGRGAYDFSPGALASLAEIQAQQDLPGALALIEHDPRLHPRSALLHFMLGELLRQAGDPAKAAAAYKKGLELDPDNAWGRRRLATLEEGG